MNQNIPKTILCAGSKFSCHWIHYIIIISNWKSILQWRTRYYWMLWKWKALNKSINYHHIIKSNFLFALPSCKLIFWVQPYFTASKTNNNSRNDNKHWFFISYTKHIIIYFIVLDVLIKVFNCNYVTWMQLIFNFFSHFCMLMNIAINNSFTWNEI